MAIRVLFCALLALVAPAAAKDLLFNGKTLEGWQFLGDRPDSKGFVVRDGAIETGGDKGILWYTREKIGNAKVRIVYRMSNGKGNSGVFIRIPEQPKAEADAIHKGIEVQIDDRDNEWHCTGVLYSMTQAKARASKPAGEWNTMEITLDGMRTVVHVNGVLITDYDGVSPVPDRKQPWEPIRGPRPAEGFIALQNHDPSAVITFREVSVEPLKK